MVTTTRSVDETPLIGTVRASGQPNFPNSLEATESRLAVCQSEVMLKLLRYLRSGQWWLITQHDRFLAGAEDAASDDMFMRTLDAWDHTERILRFVYGFQDCIHDEAAWCPAEAPLICRACAAAFQSAPVTLV